MMSGETKTCPIDGGEMKVVFSARILNKHDVRYHACGTCSFLQTEEPFWLEEAYGDAISDRDTGIMERNLHNVVRVSGVLKLLKLDREPVVDVAGGYGILTRLLRDVGFDCRWSDKYCDNILAKGFESKQSEKAAALCALEVLEHVDDPLGFLRGLIEEHGARALIFSTEEFVDIPGKEWSYYARDTGQHISFYSVKSLQSLAEALGWHYTPLPRHLHLFTQAPVKGVRSRLLRTYLLYPYAFLVLLRMRSRSRTYADGERPPEDKGGVRGRETAD